MTEPARQRSRSVGIRRAVALSLAALWVPVQAQAAEAAGWQVVGRQGIVRLVLVPGAEAKDRAAYDREIAKLCEPGQTCFLNFYANPDGVPVTVPLPDAITEQATATFRRSTKQGAEMFQWSCRLKVSVDDCF